MKVALLVTHLLGTGHLTRTSLIADALVKADHDVLLLSGGSAAPHAAPQLAFLQQLPPVRADGPAFRKLLRADGGEADPACLAERQDQIEQHIEAFTPDVLITELYPFGRRKLADEFQAAIQITRQCNPRALIFSSIRDILQAPRKPGRKEDAEHIFATQYDGALFHGAEALISLLESWDLPLKLKDRVLETGYIGDTTTPEVTSSEEILVAAGGGAVGDALFLTSIDAAKLDPKRQWRLLVGGTAAEERIATLRQRSEGANAIIEPVRPDFRSLLAGCATAVLQCGYNTALDVAATDARVVFCPFEGPGGETEQLQRAEAFRTHFGTGLIRETLLSGDTLLDTIRTVQTAPPPSYSAIALDGATRSIEILERAYLERNKA